MKYLVIDKFTNIPKKLHEESPELKTGETCIQVSDSFSLSKSVEDSIKVEKTNDDGEVLYQCYEDGESNLFAENGDGLTPVEKTEEEIENLNQYNFLPVLLDDTQDVDIDESRLNDFTKAEVITAKAEALLVDNSSYTNVYVEEFDNPSSSIDDTNSDNKIMEAHEITLFPSTSIRTDSDELDISASEIKIIGDIDDNISIEVSLNGGTDFTSVTKDIAETISGQNLVVKFTNDDTENRQAVRSFVVLYK